MAAQTASRHGINFQRRNRFFLSTFPRDLAHLFFFAALPVLTLTTQAQAQCASPQAGCGSAEPARAGANTVNMMIERGEFWRQQAQPKAALSFFTRALALEPKNPDALAGAASAAQELGDHAQSETYIARLRNAAPDHPLAQSVAAEGGRSKQDADTLLQARILAHKGQNDAALAQYSKLIHDGQVPIDIAGEYYLIKVLSLPQDSADAYDTVTEFGQVADANPKNLALQLAYAKAMVNMDATRSAGIDRLRALAKMPTIASAARAVWHDALLWQGPAPRPLQQIEDYLQDNPNDPAIEAKRQEFVQVLPSKGKLAQLRGMDLLSQSKWADAEAKFREALAEDPSDADATIFLAAAQQKQGRGDWRTLFDKAAALAPDRRTEFENILGINPEANARAAAEGAREAKRRYDEVAQLADAGKFDQAEAKMAALVASNRTAQSLTNLGDLQLRANRLPAATATLREALKLDPQNALANLTMCRLLYQQAHATDAAAFCAKAEALYTQSRDSAGLATIARITADRQRDQATALLDGPEKEQRLTEALARDPRNVWTRLALANTQSALGKTAAASATIAPVLALAQQAQAATSDDGRQAQEAAFYWARAQKDDAQAARIARTIPPGRRNADMRIVLGLEILRADIAKTDAIDDDDERLAALLALAAKPDPTGERGIILAQALVVGLMDDEIGHMFEIALQNTSPPSNPQRLTYAGALMQMGQMAASQAMLSGVNAQNLTADQRQGADAMADAMAVQQINALMQQNRLAEAQSVAKARLDAHPVSPMLRVAYARIEAASGRPAASLSQLQGLMRNAPDDLAVRMAAINAAIAARQLATADDLAREGLARFPTDASLALQAANIARQRGDTNRALQYLQQAKTLRAAELDQPGAL